MATGSRFWGQITVTSLPTWSGGGGAELNPTDGLSQGGLKGVAYALAARFCYVVRGVLSKVLVHRKAGGKRVVSISTGTATIANSSKHNASLVKKEKKSGKSKNKSATAPITAGVTGLALAMGQGGDGDCNGGYSGGDCDHHPTDNGMDSCAASASGDDADADGRHPNTLTWRRDQWRWLRQERINQVWYGIAIRYNYMVYCMEWYCNTV